MQVVQRGNRLSPASQHTQTEREGGEGKRKEAKRRLRHTAMRKRVTAHDGIDPAHVFFLLLFFFWAAWMSTVLGACVGHMLTET